MIRGLYTAVSGLVTQEARQDVVTNNLANANTVGFKGDNLAVKKFNDVLIESRDRMIGGNSKYTTSNVLGKLCMGSGIDETKTNFVMGNIQDTDKMTDFAIDGSGFFKVQSTNGTNQGIYYTRDGHFHVNTQGFLVSDSGNYILDSNNNRISVGDNKIASDSFGNLTIGNNKVQLGVVNFTDYNSLKKVGDNLYQGQNPVAVNNPPIKQNALERSNVNAINEIVNMMTIMRTFETNQKIVQYMDETLGKTVNEVGSVK